MAYNFTGISQSYNNCIRILQSCRNDGDAQRNAKAVSFQSFEDT